MKPMCESPEVFEAYALIDLGYMMLAKIQIDFDNTYNKRSPVEILVDDTTGYADELLRKHKGNLIECLEEIIKNKKIVDADFKSDELFLNALKQNKF